MKKQSPPVTPTIVRAAKRLLDKDVLNQHDIAALFGVNQGRISEIKHGKYDDMITESPDQASLF